MSKMIHDQPSAAVPASRDRRNFLIAGAGLALAATTLRRTSQFSYYNMSAHNVYYVKSPIEGIYATYRIHSSVSLLFT